MKTLLPKVMLLLLALLLANPAKSFAQDILDVDVLPVGNVNNVINGDTLANGTRANPDRIYRLQRGGVYQVTEPLRINGSLNIIATEGTERPPVLAPAILPDNSSIDHFFSFIGKGAKVNINNLYLISIRADGNQLSWSDAIRLQADSVHLTLRGVIFDGFSHTALDLQAHWNKLDVQDCHFRNHKHGTSWFGGGGFLSGYPIHQDTSKFINNTFFSNNSYNWSIRGYTPKAIFEHNTLVYGTVNPLLMDRGFKLDIKNNLFYAVHAFGGNPTHVIDGWFLNYPDTASSSIIQIRANDSISPWSQAWAATILGPEDVFVDPALGVTADMVTPDKRELFIENNAYFWPQELMDFIDAYNDTTTKFDSITVPNGTPEGGRAWVKREIRKPKFISDYARYVLDSIFTRNNTPHSFENNIEADPGFTDANVLNHLDDLINYISKISTDRLDNPWWFDPNNSLYPPAWPLPENLRYTNPDLMTAGTDGLPLGDLNWFPELKPTDVKQTSEQVPEQYKLSDAYPNPFNPETKFDFSLTNAGNVKISIYNVIGQKVRSLINTEMKAGNYTATWNGKDDSGKQVVSGTYIYSLETNSVRLTRKMVLLK